MLSDAPWIRFREPANHLREAPPWSTSSAHILMKEREPTRGKWHRPRADVPHVPVRPRAPGGAPRVVDAGRVALRPILSDQTAWYWGHGIAGSES